jgi:hypothetical protein
MKYYNLVKEVSSLLTAFIAMNKLPEDYVNAYSLRSILKSTLDDLDKTRNTNGALQRMMRGIDFQIKNPKTDYHGKNNDDLIILRENMEGGAAW